jgi:NAD(P)-dependent dehydrogenase (short-subunit alcohol dehydrogenase family)
VTIIDRFRLNHKVAVITGASSGLGRGFAQLLARQALPWRAIDAHERSEGMRTGRPRVKLVDRAVLLAVGRQSVTEQHGAVDCGMSTR